MDHAARRKRLLSRSSLAQPYMERFSSLRRLTSPSDLAPWPALILKLGSVEQETDDEEEPV